jgi:putative oxygen-independent coproporphyrinogen III oxidase
MSEAQQTRGARPSEPDDCFAVYVHWPFCAAKCPYCDFNSHVRHGGWDEAAFLSAYLRELETTRALTGPRVVHSIFFGGGTPSLMQPTTTAAILDAIARHWTVEEGAEITLEANPGSVEAARFAGFKSAGVNRVSLGVQSLDDEQLRKLGRIHSVAEAKAALDVARKTFDRFSFDLIYARPGQTLADWRAELAEALTLAGEHLSLYQLTIEPATPFEQLYKAGKLKVPGDELARDLYALTQDMTAERGLPAYEISNHARPGSESRHNLVYWRYGAYAGIGPGAHGRLLIDGVRHATQTERNPELWQKRVMREGHGMTERLALTRDEAADEALLMGLRLVEGLDLAVLQRLAGVAPAAATIAKLAELDLVERVGPSRLRATLAGRLVLNAVVAELSAALAPV